MQMTSSVPARRLNAATDDEILVIIGRVELRKQIKPLGRLQRIELAELLYSLNETKGQIEWRADSVVLQETYGTISFQYWVNDLVCLRSDFNKELYRLKKADEGRRVEFQLSVSLELDRRLETFRRASTDKQKMQDVRLEELEGIRLSLEQWHNKLKEIRERSKAQMTRRLQYAKQVLRAMDEDARKKILDIAVERGRIESYDAVIVQHAYLLADKLYDILESQK